MPHFNDIIQKNQLTKNSSFEAIAQAAIETYYLIPYPKSRDIRPKINRHFHGGTHVSSTAINIDLLIALYEKYSPESLITPEGSHLTRRQVDLLKLAAIYHDSANTSEVTGDEHAHAENFKRDMELLGFDSTETEPFVMVIRNKEGSHENPHHDTKNIYQQLLEDADRLEVIRVKGDGFDINRLDILKVCKEKSGFLKEINEIVNNHKTTLDMFYKKEAIHTQCEYADNCYNAVYAAEKNLLLESILLQCLVQGKIVTFDEIDLSTISILDLFNRNNSDRVKQIIQSHVTSESKSIDHAEGKPNHVLEMFSNGGCYVRALPEQGVNGEISVLDQNRAALDKAQLHDTASLQKFLSSQSERKEIFTPEGFKWRPFTFVEKGLPVKIYSSSSIAFIIDPLEKGTIASHFYKKNAFSKYAATGQFVYEQKSGPLKNRKDKEGIQIKTHEMTNRLAGVQRDPGIHYFANKELDHNEVLGTYTPASVMGILVGDNADSASEALLARSKLGYPLRPFFRYSPQAGLTHVTDEEILKQFKGKIESRETLSLSKITDQIQIINLTHPGTLTLTDPISYKTRRGGMDEMVVERTLVFKPTNNAEIDNIILNIINFPTKDMVLRNELKRLGICEKELDLSFDRYVDSQPDMVTSRLCVADCGLSRDKLSLVMYDYILGGIQKVLENPAEYLKQQKQNKLIQGLDLLKIQEINCISDNPFQLKFTHPADPSVICLASVKNNVPIIEFQSLNGEYFEYESNLVKKIALRYYSFQVETLNKLFKVSEIENFLTSHGVENLTLEFISDHSDKSCLSIKIMQSNNNNNDMLTNVIKELLPFDKIKSAPVLFNKSEKRSLRQFVTLDVQQVDDVILHINKIIHDAKNKNTVTLHHKDVS